MGYIEVILMAIVQGLSEFLPISSSAHLVFTSNICKLFNDVETTYNAQEVFLDIVLHFGTLIAVLIYYRREVLQIIKALITACKTRNFTTADAKIGIYLIAGTFITVLIAYPLHDIAEVLVFTPMAVGILLTFTGFLMLFSEYISKNILEKKENLDWKSTTLIAIAQGLAALPGFSRSGLTISTGLLCGLDRSKSARYSFLLSIPIILGASMLYPFIKLDLNEVAQFDFLLLATGAIVSGIVGYFCIKYFIKFISKFSLKIFGIYCLIVGFGMTMLFYFVR